MEIIKFTFKRIGEERRIKFFSRPHPLGGVSWCIDDVINGKSEGIIEERNKETMLDLWQKTIIILEKDGWVK